MIDPGSASYYWRPSLVVDERAKQGPPSQVVDCRRQFPGADIRGLENLEASIETFHY